MPEVNESPRLIAHRRFLANLNADIERPVIIPMEIVYTTPATIPTNGDVELSTYPVPQNKDLFITGLTGFVEIGQTAAPATIEEPQTRCIDNVTIRLMNDNDKEEISTPTPLTMSQIISSHRRTKGPFKLPSIWRVPAGDTVRVEFTILPNWLLVCPAQEVRRIGIALVGILIREAELLEYGRV